MIKYTASPAEVTDADAQAAGTTSRRDHSDPMTSENTNSGDQIDCTIESRPLHSASARNTKLAITAATPNSHSGLQIK